MLTRLRDLTELVKRHVYDCCIAMMDLDHFKAINETTATTSATKRCARRFAGPNRVCLWDASMGNMA